MKSQVELFENLMLFQAGFPVPVIFETPEKEIAKKLSHVEIKKKAKNYSEYFLGFKRVKGSYNQNWRWNE